MALTLTILTGEGGKKKGRSFSAEVFAYATASGLFEGSTAGNTLRPAYLFLATSDEEARPLLENLRAGEKALMKGDPGPLLVDGPGTARHHFTATGFTGDPLPPTTLSGAPT